MNNQVFTDIKKTINIISLLQARCKKFKEEHDFFKKRWSEISKENNKFTANLYLSALERLEHETMFLIIQVYSLYEGISKKQSLVSSSIRDSGAALTKIDKTETVNQGNFIDGGVFTNDGHRNSTQEEKKNSIRQLNNLAVSHRKELKKSSGIKSKNHDEIEKWASSIINNEDLEKLQAQRSEYAHNLDTLDKIQNNGNYNNNINIDNSLNLADRVLTSYKTRLNEILCYTCSESYRGFVGTYYDSLSRLETVDNYERINKKIDLTNHFT